MYALKRITFTARRYHPRMMYITPGDFWMSHTFLTRSCGKTSETRPPLPFVYRAEASNIRYFSITLPTIFTNPRSNLDLTRAATLFCSATTSRDSFHPPRGLKRSRKFMRLLRCFHVARIIFHSLVFFFFFGCINWRSWKIIKRNKRKVIFQKNECSFKFYIVKLIFK